MMLVSPNMRQIILPDADLSRMSAMALTEGM